MESSIRLVSIVTALLVVTSFALFARDQLSGASKHQQAELAAGLPTTSPGAIPTVAHHAQPRRFIDGAAAQLESPFRAVVSTSNEWLKRTIPAVLAVALYGFGIAYLGRYMHGRA